MKVVTVSYCEKATGPGQNITALHNDTIEETSCPGKGSKFSFAFMIDHGSKYMQAAG